MYSKYILPALLCGAAILGITACGDDVINVDKNNVYSVTDSLDSLDCTKDNEGQVTLVKETGKMYTCSEGEWKIMNGTDAVNLRCHSDLLKDEERLAAFFNAIEEYGSNTGLAYDLGCGSGILSYFLSPYFDEIISLEKNTKIARLAKENLSNFSNIQVVNSDILDYGFTKKADLIVCEMMDTG